MKTLKFGRTALVIALAMTIILSVTGGTIAWFTDEVSSTGNKIQSGTLDVKLEYQLGNGTWAEVKDGTDPLFNHDKWEPGYVATKVVRVSNAGTLALKYNLNVATSEVTDDYKLADVIDVYLLPAEPAVTRADIAAATPVGTLSELMADEDGAAHGILLPAGSAANNAAEAVGNVAFTLALKMREEADNNYQGLSVGDGIAITLVATQYTYEEDSFGSDYDENAAHPSAFAFLYDGQGYDSLDALLDAVKAAPGGTMTLNKDLTISETLEIAYNMTINGGGHKVVRGEGFTGTMLNVAADATLKLENVTVDGGAVWTGEKDATLGRGTTNSGVTATGNLIAAGNNAKVELNAGAVLQNNDGSHAVNLGTRIGATLTLNGGKIINNQSGSGAVWGGGNITINEGEISSNSSTGLAGAIRMVGSCNLTMNGGAISNNKAASDGGAIWGYGASTYTFSGGEMNGNEAGGTGGAMFTGTYSVLNISGDFELCNNKADNSGAIRLTDHTSLTMTGGTVSGNTQNGESNAFNTWNNTISLTGGAMKDNISYVGGLGLTMGEVDMDGVISYDLVTNHNTAYLAAKFNGFSFKVNESAANFSNFNFKPAAGYTYSSGDENKLVCLNNGYETYWDAATGTFRLQAK